MKLIGKTVVFCMLCLLSISVNAQDQSCGDGVTWNYKDGTLTISYTGSGTGAMCDYSNGDLRPWNDKASDIETIIIGDGVTNIGNRAFTRCNSVTSVTIPTSVKSIGTYAFFQCLNLTSVTIPTSVKSLGDNAFDECGGLKSVTLSDSLTSIGKEAFNECTSLTEVTIPASVKSIGYNAFCKCSSLTGVTIPQSVTSIGECAFDKCEKLSSVKFADGINLTDLGQYVFRDCSSLTDITLPGSMTSISMGLFCGCSKLTSITFPAGLTTIGSDAFNGTGLTSVSIPASVASIGGYAFDMCGSLETLSFADGGNLTSIGESAFYSCISLTSVKIPASVTTIGASAFSLCSSLTDVYVKWTDPFTLSGDASNSIFYYSNNKNLTLHVPYGKIDAYKSKNWEYSANPCGFADFELGNLAYVDGDGQQHDEFDFAGGPLTINDNNQLFISFKEDVAGVDITYTRTFSSSTVWQAWYMPFDADYETELSEKYYVAQILGAFMDAGGNTYITFQPMTSGTVKANTPYVVKPKTAGDVTITIQNATLKQTKGTPFTIQSSTKNFTFGGVYEKTVNNDKGWYAINKEGNFQALDTDVYLKPMRFWMTITDRSDNPYAPAPTSNQVSIRVLGDTPTDIGLIKSDEQQSGSVYRLSDKIVIMNGKKYLR